MAVQILPIISAVQITNAAALYFTAQVRTRVDKMTVTNTDASNAHWVEVWWVPSGGSSGVTNLLQPKVYLQPLQAYDVYPFIGHTLGILDSVWAQADASSVLNFFASGTTQS